MAIQHSISSIIEIKIVHVLHRK